MQSSSRASTSKVPRGYKGATEAVNPNPDQPSSSINILPSECASRAPRHSQETKKILKAMKDCLERLVTEKKVAGEIATLLHKAIKDMEEETRMAQKMKDLAELAILFQAEKAMAAAAARRSQAQKAKAAGKAKGFRAEKATPPEGDHDDDEDESDED